jgi:hypothetical protein
LVIVVTLRLCRRSCLVVVVCCCCGCVFLLQCVLEGKVQSCKSNRNVVFRREKFRSDAKIRSESERFVSKI